MRSDFLLAFAAAAGLASGSPAQAGTQVVHLPTCLGGRSVLLVPAQDEEGRGWPASGDKACHAAACMPKRREARIRP